MIVGFVLILSVVGMALATALYSNFLPYFSLLSDVKNYNMAYYGANSAIERSLLVLRYQEAGFEGQGGWNKKTGVISAGPASDTVGWGYYDTTKTTLQRSIASRPSGSSIPGTGQGNTDFYFLSGASNDRNTLAYHTPQKIPLWVDNTLSASAYSGDEDRDFFTGSNLALQLQLVPSVKDKFTDNTLGGTSRNLQDTVDNDGDGVANDIIVDRGRKGLYGTPATSFSIIPRSLVVLASGASEPSVQSDDESIRESNINTSSSIDFGATINPLCPSSSSCARDTHLMISDDSATAGALSGKNFDNLLLPDNNLYSQELNLFLTKYLISDRGIYPLLQYKIGFGGEATLAQPYFTIHGKSQVGDYTVQMTVKKSINKNETLSSFTVVF